MAGSFTAFLDNALLNHVFGGVPYSAPTLYLGLFTSTPGVQPTTEVSNVGTGYVRMPVSAPFTVTGNQAANSITVEWPTASGAGYGTLTQVAIFDAAAGGNMLAWGDLTATRTVLAGDIARFTAGQLTVGLS